MTTENSTVKTVSLTAEQYCTVLNTSHFLSAFLALVEDSGLNLPLDTITPLLNSVAVELQSSLQVFDSTEVETIET